MDELADAAIASVLGVYVIRVGIAGNGKQLITLLGQETGYLELLIAGYLLMIIKDSKTFGPVANQLIMVAALAVIIKIATKNGNIITAIENFGAGKANMVDTFKAIFAL